MIRYKLYIIQVVVYRIISYKISFIKPRHTLSFLKSNLKDIFTHNSISFLKLFLPRDMCFLLRVPLIGKSSTTATFRCSHDDQVSQRSSLMQIIQSHSIWHPDFRMLFFFAWWWRSVRTVRIRKRQFWEFGNDRSLALWVSEFTWEFNFFAIVVVGGEFNVI